MVRVVLGRTGRRRSLGGLLAAAGVSATVVFSVGAPPASANVADVPCTTPALIAAIAGAPSGATLILPAECTYVLTSPYLLQATGLPPIAQHPLTIIGNGATIERVSE